ncbi:MAG: hypothetical protein V2I79_13525 [Xanthomonadales bacterium]|nr:hypothetical protein [Xanthomonadales bacterium]
MSKQKILVFAKRAAVLLAVVAMVALVGCGGTKVYTADKTMVYRGSLYNLGAVQKVSTREEAKLANDEIVQLGNKDKNALQAFFKENSKVLVSMIFELDQEEVVYLRTNVDSYSEYNRLKKRFEKATDDIADFMADKKDTQLKLK